MSDFEEIDSCGEEDCDCCSYWWREEEILKKELASRDEIIKKLGEILREAVPQSGKRTKILKDGDEEIDCLLIPSLSVFDALALIEKKESQ